MSKLPPTHVAYGPDDPRRTAPGVPNATRYGCPVPGCVWFHDEPPPDLYTSMTRSAAQIARDAELPVATHALTHREDELPANMRAALQQWLHATPTTRHAGPPVAGELLR